MKQLLNQVGMEKFSKRKMKNLSGGMVRRVDKSTKRSSDNSLIKLRKRILSFGSNPGVSDHL